MISTERPVDLLARTLHLARFMLAQRPQNADLLLTGIDTAHLPDDYRTGRFVAAFRSESEIDYIVGDHGTFMTTTVLPAWADASDVRDLGERARAGTELWDLLTGTAEALQEADPELYEKAELARTLEVVGAYYRDPEFAAVLHHTAGVPAITLAELEQLLADPEAIRTWAQNAYACARENFLSLKVPIEEARKALATLGLFQLWRDARAPLGATILRTARPGIGPEDVEALATDPREVLRAATEFPLATGFWVMFEPGFYVTHAELAGGGGLRAAWQVAATLERAGTDSLDMGREISSLQLFYGLLADGLLSFMAADWLFGFIESMFSQRSASAEAFPELKARRVVCEERRVSVLASLFHAIGVREEALNPTSFPSIGVYIDVLAAGSLQEAELATRDLALRLVVPTFVRELVRGSVYRIKGHPDAAREILMPVLDRLETDRPRNSLVPAEPNFIRPVREELARTFEALDDAGMATTMRNSS